MEYIEVKQREYSSIRLANVASLMDQYGFLHCDLNPDGKFRGQKKLDFRYFSVTASLIFDDLELAVWIEDGKEMIFCGRLPDHIQDVYALNMWISDYVFKVI